MRMDDYIRVDTLELSSLFQCHIFRWLLNFHSELLFGDPLKNMESEYGLQHHPLWMKKLRPRDAKQLLQVHTAEQWQNQD